MNFNTYTNTGHTNPPNPGGNPGGYPGPNPPNPGGNLVTLAPQILVPLDTETITQDTIMEGSSTVLT